MVGLEEWDEAKKHALARMAGGLVDLANEIAPPQPTEPVIIDTVAFLGDLSGSYDLDLSIDVRMFVFNVVDILNLSFINPSEYRKFQLLAVNNGAGLTPINWPAGVRWHCGVTPVRATSAINIPEIFTFYYVAGFFYGVLEISSQSILVQPPELGGPTS